MSIGWWLGLLACGGGDKSGDDTGPAATSGVDADRDGVPEGEDCDDTNPLVRPTAQEQCNGIDDDCDGLIDFEDDTLLEGSGGTYYVDGDGDGVGDPSQPVQACQTEPGLSSLGTDCDDANPYVRPSIPELCNGFDDNCDDLVDEADPFLDLTTRSVYYQDGDGDGFGSGPASYACRPPDGSAPDNDDCNDADDAIFPGAVEVCNEVDDDCDFAVDADDASLDVSSGSLFYEDADRDGHGDPDSSQRACEEPPGFVPTADDCDDDNRSVSPSASEVCNGVDDDCDLLVDDEDEGLLQLTARTWYLDEDGDGFGVEELTLLACNLPLGAASQFGDCNDANPDINPRATEICNGVDDDCDTFIDAADDTLSLEGAPLFYADDDGDGFGDPADGLPACALTPGRVANDDDCDDSLRAVSPAASEVCNGRDDDCDALVDDRDPSVDPLSQTEWLPDADGDGFGLDEGPAVLACAQPLFYSLRGGDCNDGLAGINPSAQEICDGRDNDCDTLIDDADVLSLSTGVFMLPDGDGDGFGRLGAPVVQRCALEEGFTLSSGDCDDTSPAVNPGALEVCNGLDDDCDLLTDDLDPSLGGPEVPVWYRDEDGDGQGAVVISACIQPLRTSAVDGDCDDADAAAYTGAVEVCDGRQNACELPWAGDDGRATLFGPGGPTEVGDLVAAGGFVLDQDGTRLALCAGTWPPLVVAAQVELEAVDGAVLDAAGVGSVLTVSSGASLVARDLALVGGCAAEGAGLRVERDASVTWEGGRIEGNACADRGGAVFADSAELSLSGVTLADNSAFEGAGLYAARSAVSLTDVVISGNSSGGDGAGLFLESGSLNAVDLDLLENESAGAGGGAWVGGLGVELTWTGGRALDNLAVQSGGALAQFAGAADLTGVTLERNDAETSGGAVFVRGAALTLDGVVARSNSSDLGGFLRAEGGARVDLVAGQYLGNVVSTSGAVMSLVGSSGSCASTAFYQNQAVVSGGVLLFEPGVADRFDAAACDFGSLVNVNRPDDIFLNSVRYDFAGVRSITCDAVSCR